MMSEHAWRSGGAGTDGSYSGFEVNKTAPLVEMEKGMVVQSGNDAAIALAEHVAGSEQAFAQLMNAMRSDRHEEVALRQSAWPHRRGPRHHRPRPGHLGRALIRDFPEAYSYNKIKELTVGPITQPNRNLLLWRDPSVDGIKTGHTFRRGLLPDGLGQARRPAPDHRGDGQQQREPARGGFAGAAQLGLPLLRIPPPVRGQQVAGHAQGVEGRCQPGPGRRGRAAAGVHPARQVRRS
jgi:hypothetical protein